MRAENVLPFNGVSAQNCYSFSLLWECHLQTHIMYNVLSWKLDKILKSVRLQAIKKIRRVLRDQFYFENNKFHETLVAVFLETETLVEFLASDFHESVLKRKIINRLTKDVAP